MGKIVKNFFILCTLLLNLFGESIEENIDSLNKKISFSSETEVVRIFHNLKNLYINTIISGDQELQQKALEGMIKSAKVVNFDYKRYEDELRILLRSKQKEASNSPFSVEDIVKITPEPKTKQMPMAKTLAKVSAVSVKNSAVYITFNQPLTKNDIVFFELNQKNHYKDVYDIKGDIGNYKIPKLSTNTINQIRMAQNQEDKIRLVLEDDKKIVSSFTINKNIIAINFSPTQKAAQTAAPAAQTQKSPKKSVYGYSKTIVIDPGHGGKDSGAVGYKGYLEKKAVLQVAKYLKEDLKKKGFKVYLTREDDTFISLSERTEFANQKKADLFISIHGNAAPKKHYLSLKGIETFFLSPAKNSKAERVAAKENESVVKTMGDISKNAFLHMLNRKKIIQSNKLAIDIQAGMLSQVRKKYKDVVDGGVREAPFWVLVGAQMPAILIELGYVTNPKEAERLFNPFYQRRLAKGIADGISSYFYKNR